MMNHVANVTSPSYTFSASRVPAATAMSLPPSKRRNTGNKWPRNMAITTRVMPVSSTPKRAASHCASHTTS